MNEESAAILGIWLFAVATAASNRVAGWFMAMAFVAALVVTGKLL